MTESRGVPRVPKRGRPPPAPTTGRTRVAPRADPFVGRTGELQQLREALDLATHGHPQVVVVTGDAGIGKSRLLSELTHHAVGAGVELLAGACQEDAGVPYLPIATALAVLGRAATADPFIAFGHEAELRAAADPGTTRDGGDAHLRLFLAVSEMLLAAAKARPTMLVVEDAHWIDDASLGLLRHLLAVVVEDAVAASARLMVVVTSRGPDPTTPAGIFVERLIRRHGATSVALHSLDEHECRELVAAWLDREPSATLVDRLMEATAGQPLVLRSVLTRLDNLVSIGDPALANLLGPTDLDHELWRRVEALEPATREMVLTAAFLGDGSALAVLGEVCDLDREQLDVLLDDASEHHVLVADDDRYRFEHTQLRQLVYHWPTGRDRAVRHLFLADRLEAAGEKDVAAHHLARARMIVEPSRLLEACGAAADRTAAIGAWLEAARYASVALAAAADLDLPDEDVAALELRAGYASLTAGDRPTGIDCLSRAAETARSCDAIAIWGRALVHLARLGSLTTEIRGTHMRILHQLDEFLAVAGDRDPRIRAEVHALESELYSDINDIAAARSHAAQAEELAAGIDDDDLQVKVGLAIGLQRLGAAEVEAAEASFASASEMAASLVDVSPLAWCLTRRGLVAYLRGKLELADSVLADALVASRNAENGAELSFGSAIAAAVATMRGDSDLLELHAERSEYVYRRSGFAFTPLVLFPTLAAARASRGDRAGANEALDRFESIHAPAAHRYRPLIDALTGDLDRATTTLDASTFRLFTGAPAPDYLLAGPIAAQVELGALTARPALVRGPVATLIELYDRGMRFTTGWPAFIPRVVGLGLAATDRADEADAWFVRALADARAAGATAEIARSALDYARVLGEHRPHDAAHVEELLSLAREAFDSMSIWPRVPGSEQLRGHTSLRRALPDRQPVTRVLLVTDIVSSTALNYRVGDPAYIRIVEEHNRLARHRFARHDAKEFKTTGDGIGAWFYSVQSALRCALELRRDFATMQAEQSEPPVHVKIALTVGEPTPIGSDLLGIDVTLAFRAVGLAAPGEIVVTNSVVALAQGGEWAFDPRGGHFLKGIDEEIELFAVRSITN
jgi:class 3 adenylate cyclase